MQAAFVDIGLEKAAFLYVADVFDAIEEYESLLYAGSKKDDEPSEEQDGTDRSEYRPLHPIEDLLQEGQELLVQISKEPLGTKGARITSHISLPGRHLVYMPTVDHIGISRRIEDEEERERLREIVERLKKPGSGYIVRTVSEGKSEEDLIADMQYLTTLWEEISGRQAKSAVPSLLHSDLDVVQKVVRDIVTEQVDKIVVDFIEQRNNLAFQGRRPQWEVVAPILRNRMAFLEEEKQEDWNQDEAEQKPENSKKSSDALLKELTRSHCDVGKLLLQPRDTFINRGGDIAAESRRTCHRILRPLEDRQLAQSLGVFYCFADEGLRTLRVFRHMRRELLPLISYGGDNVDEDSRHHRDRDGEDRDH
jgi:hypothetical protein